MADIGRPLRKIRIDPEPGPEPEPAEPGGQEPEPSDTSPAG